MGQFWRQIEAIMERRLKMHHRQTCSFFRFLLPLLLIDAFAIAMIIIIRKFSSEPDVVTFKDLTGYSPVIVTVGSQEQISTNLAVSLRKSLIEIAESDLGQHLDEIIFDTPQEFNDWVYKIQYPNYTGTKNTVLAGLEFGSGKETDQLHVTLLYNDSKSDENGYINQLQRSLWKTGGLGDLQITQMSINSNYIDITGIFVGLFFAIGVIVSVSPIIMSVIDDVKKSKRDYMLTCHLSLLNYWIGTLIADYIVYLLGGVASFILFICMGVETFKNLWFTILWGIIFDGISLLLFVYVISFLFDSPETGSAFSSILLMIPIFITYIVDMIRSDSGDSIVKWVYGLTPMTNIYGIFAQSIFTNSDFKPYYITSVINIILYSLLLTIIEYARKRLEKDKAKTDFPQYSRFFARRKASQPVTTEAKDMETSVFEGDYIIKLKRVSRLFFNELKKPIAAVNDVSLGIKKGSLFGFLGANGAGKSTIITMLSGGLSPSSGEIEIDGQLIDRNCNLALCPQSNDHLTNELTPIEHLKIYGKLYGLSDEAIKVSTDKFIDVLELDEHKDKIVKTLSGGNARKLAISLAMISPSNIVLLDEPTSSLDPVARHHVHALIKEYHGQKTFMLCTHLLDEAESLCDEISIMIKGCIYVVGTPQYLSSKFGVEWKADILLENASPDCASSAAAFMASRLPDAKISVDRPKNKVYSIPVQAIDLPDLFKVLKEGVESHIFKYFTCSSSSLEKVFLELVMRSEEDDQVDDNDDETENIQTNLLQRP